MMKINYLFLTGLLLFMFMGQSKAQSRSALEDEAYDYLNNNEFVKAYAAFDQLYSRYPKELDYQFKLGICCLSYPEKKERAIEIFLDMRNKYKTREAEFYLGRAYHANYRFDEALAVLDPLVAAISVSKKKEDKAMVEDAKQIINNCKNGKILLQNKLSSHVVNIGSPINTKEIEGVPVVNGDETMMIFTYVGKRSMGGKVNASLQADAGGIYTSDIYMTTRSNRDSAWKPATPIAALNTRGNDAAIAISPDGSTLFTFLSTNEIAGDIYVSKLKGTEFSKPEALNENINTSDYWEGSCSISADGKFLYFSSERPTGLGGKDIWVSELTNGDWGPAVNMGPNINTPYDDDAPFIHPDGVTLFFSSKGHTSIGGYDIMFSTKSDGVWTEPKSMGIPLNTTEDDSYYVINSKGDMGYFSSDRAISDARGSQDIYTVNPGILGEKLIVALYKGVITGDGKPVEARIEVIRESKNEMLGPYVSNKSTGKYLLTFKPGSVYKVKLNAEGYEPYEEEINLETLTNYSEYQKDFVLYSKAYMASNPEAKPGSVTKEIISATVPVVTAEEPKVTEEIATGTLVTVAPVDEPKKVDPKEEQKQVATTKAEEKKAAAIAKAEEKKAAAIAKAEEKKAVAAAKEEERKAAVLAKVEEKKKKEEAKLEAVKEPVETASPCNGKLPELAALKGKSLNDPANYKMLMDIAGEYCAQGVVFKVQIGAYKNPENFKYANLKSLGKVESEMYPDGITRFTQKQFSNLKDAEKHRQKSIAKGQADSWIVVFVNGQRYTLEDFINVDFLGKAVN